MFRAAPRLVARPSALRALPHCTQTPTRRFISTAPPHKKSRSWKSLVGRVGIVGAIIYFYNTTEIFAEEPRHAVHQVQPGSATDDETETLPTIEALARERAQRKAELVAEKERAQASEGGVQELEEEAGQQGAFNPETGEINWDCPCLGGMATGPCGEQFKAAFSCFVHSTEEPKGMDCVDKFKDMQNCFREYPEVYGNELEGDDDDDAPGDEELAALAESESAPSDNAEDSRPASERRPQEGRAQAEVQQRKKEQALSGSDEVIPRETHDDREANAGKKAIKEQEQEQQ